MKFLKGFAFGQSGVNSLTNSVSGPVLSTYDSIISVINSLAVLGFSIFESITRIALSLFPAFNIILQNIFDSLSHIPIVGTIINTIGNALTGLTSGLTPGVNDVLTSTHDILNSVFLFNNVSQFDILFPGLRNVLSTVLDG